MKWVGTFPMKTLVIYDIPKTKVRNRVAEACLDYGLERVQWSAFRGEVNHNRREELEQRLRKALGRQAGNIQIYPICDKDLNLRIEIAVSKEDAKEEEKPTKLKKKGKKRQSARTRGVTVEPAGEC